MPRLKQTIVEPTGVPATMDTSIPDSEQKTESTAAQMVTDKKERKTRIAASAGKMTSAEISSAPTSFIASTMITAMTTAMKKL